MSLINGAVLEKKICEVLQKELVGIETKNGQILSYLHMLEERIKILENMIQDKEHDCDECGGTFEMSDIDLVDGKWLCRLCEDELNGK